MRCLLCQCGEKMSGFTTITEGEYFEETEKRSRFISYSFPVNSEIEAMKFLKQIKTKYPDARHHVYGYVINGFSEKYSDDGEPSGTGGLPIINAIKSMNLSNVLVVVVRYFGGILLGTGGLRKMYGSGALNVLSISKKVKLTLCSRMCVNVDYHNYSKILSMLSKNGAKIISTDYLGDIKLEFLVRKESSNDVIKKFSDILKNNECVQILSDEYCVV